MRALCCLLLFLLVTPAQLLAESFCSAPHFPHNESYIVVDDGNNLRQWGGDNYASAPILAVLNSWDEVRLIRNDGRWAEVETVDGIRGFMSAQYIMQYDAYIRQGLMNDQNYDFTTCYEPHPPKQVDLDGDGRMETMQFNCEPGMWCANIQTQIYSQDGRLLYESPSYGDSPFIFCDCEFGIYFPDIIADITGDRNAEMLIAQPQSDVSPAIFDLYSWSGSEFYPILNNFMLTADRSNPNLLRSTPAQFTDQMPYLYVFSMREYSGQRFIAGIASEDWRIGEAIVHFDGRDFVLEQWSQPLQ